MQLHQLKSTKGSRKRRKIVGRGPGSGHGKTSCRGQNGQGSRSGRGILKSLEGGQMPVIRRLAKVGFRNRNSLVYQYINVKRHINLPNITNHFAPDLLFASFTIRHQSFRC